MAPANILVTGANRGIGLGLVKTFLQSAEVKRVFATARKPEDATELKAISDPRLTIIQLEVTNDESIEKAYAEVEKVVGDEGLNLLVNNAGIFVAYHLRHKYNRAEFHRQLDVNTVSPIVIAQVFMPLLQKAAVRSTIGGLTPNRAALVNISSMAGSIGTNDPAINPDFQYPDLPAYRASKSALNSAMRVFANEFCKDGVLTACFCPGWVKTDMGGQEAHLTLEQSMADLVPTIYGLTDKQNGGYFNIKGEVIPF